MGMRKYQRAIAKDRMRCLGVRSNLLGSGIMPHGGPLRKKMRTEHGRRYLAWLMQKKEARWRRVTTGDLAKEALRAQLLEGQRIKKRKMVQDSMQKRKIRKVTAPAL